MEWLWLGLQDSWFGVAARQSPVLYPAANILHVLGVMGFFAFVAVMDLALLGALPGVSRASLASRAAPHAGQPMRTAAG